MRNKEKYIERKTKLQYKLLKQTEREKKRKEKQRINVHVISFQNRKVSFLCNPIEPKKWKDI